MIEVWLDQVGYFLVGGGELAPMDAGLIVVGGMITVVEHHKIGEPAGKIARMIKGGLFVCVDVLDIIEDHDDKEGNLLGDDDEENCLTPIQ